MKCNEKLHNDDDVRKNGSGCFDPTAYEAIKNIDESNYRFYKLLHTIFYICNLAGFYVEGRIVLKDMKTGKTWK